MAVEAGTIVAGDFRIVERIAEGGMGEVYVVEQISTSKRRALKLMKRELAKDQGLLARFEQEARIGSRIESDHIVEVVAAGIDTTHGVPWLAMELLQGENLGQLLARRGPLSAHEARVLFAQIGHALGAAHRAGVVHRDLKPENVFIARVRELGVDFKVKILDFGIAKLFEDVKSNATGVASLGTPRYMAPEQTGGQAITPSTDVWALGLIAFQVLTSRYYWKRAAGGPNENVMTLMREVLFEPLVPASKRAEEIAAPRGVPAGFDAWFARCVAREPAERFRDGAEAQAALDPILAAAAYAHRPHGPTGMRPSDPSSPPLAGLTSISANTRPPMPSPLGQSLANVPLTTSTHAPAPRPKPSPAVIAGLIAAAVGVTCIGGYAVYAGANASKKTKHASDDADRKAKHTAAADDAKLPTDLAGTYETEGVMPNGDAYTGTVVINDARVEDCFDVLWSSGYGGVAMRSKNVLAVGWGRDLLSDGLGVAVYDVDHGHLNGRVSTAFSRRRPSRHVLEGPDGLEGNYRTTDAEDPRMNGSMSIHRNGASYDVQYSLGRFTLEGAGILVDHKLVVGFGPQAVGAGVMVYTADGKDLAGKWGMFDSGKLGKEKLKRTPR